MAQGPINLSLFGSKVARGTPNPEFLQFFFFFFFVSNPLAKIRPALSTVPSFDDIPFSGQEQLCPLTCAGRRDLSKLYKNEHNSVKETEETATKNHVTLTWNLHEKLAPLPTYLSEHLILRWWKNYRLSLVFITLIEELPFLIKPTECPASRKKKWGKESEKRGKERKRKVKVESVVLLLNPKTMSEFCFLRMPNFASAYFAPGWKGRGVYNLGNGFVGRFSS